MSQRFELRQYTLHPGTRDSLIALFEDHFLDHHRELGMDAPGIFRDLDRPDRFVWIRSFSPQAARATALERFYTSPIWRTHRGAANATMIDSDDVLQLQPVSGGGLVVPPAAAGPPPPAVRVEICIARLAAPADGALRSLFSREIAPLIARAGGQLIGWLVTDPAPNDFPRLPIRTAPTLVWLAQFADDAALEAHRSAPAWAAIAQQLAHHAIAPLERLRLAPTARSRLGHPVEGAEDASIHDFDFLATGTWTVRNRRLRARGVGSTEWDEVFARYHGAMLHMGSVVNTDVMDVPAQGWSGMSVRAFDRARRRWKIYWVNSRDGLVTPPVEGAFDGARGEFIGDDVDDGRPVNVRFVWTIAGPREARWEQSFRHGDGPWELNWTMEFARDA
jgi:hypothetical protein